MALLTELIIRSAPLMVAEMSASAVSVQMPLSVLHDCLTLRCIHTNFDNYSQYAKSFDPCLPDGNVDVNAGILDIEECLANEWYMQLDIQTDLLLNLLEKREAYDEALRIIAEKTEKMNKEKKNNEGNGTKINIPKAPKEALLVPPGMLPDAYSAFLEREQQQYMDMLDEIYNPANLKLTLDEVSRVAARQHKFVSLYDNPHTDQSETVHYAGRPIFANVYTSSDKYALSEAQHNIA